MDRAALWMRCSAAAAPAWSPRLRSPMATDTDTVFGSDAVGAASAPPANPAQAMKATVVKRVLAYMVDFLVQPRRGSPRRTWPQGDARPRPADRTSIRSSAD